MAVAIERGRSARDRLAKRGEIVRRGAQHGVPTPLNRELVSLVHDIVAKRARPGLETLYGVYLRLNSGQLEISRQMHPVVVQPEDSRARNYVRSRNQSARQWFGMS